MAKPQNSRRTAAKQPSAFARFLAKTGLARMKDQVVTAADGSEFTVEREDGDPQIGDSAYPDGNYILDDGTEIVVEGERITDIIDPVEDNTDDDPDPLASANDPEEIRELIAELQGRLKELDPDATPEENAPQVEELQQTVDELQKKVEEQEVELKSARPIVAKVNRAGGMSWLDQTLGMRSTYTPQNRRFVAHGAPAGQQAPQSKTRDAINKRREAVAAKREQRRK